VKACHLHPDFDFVHPDFDFVQSIFVWTRF
jgi:hypothetical protein